MVGPHGNGHREAADSGEPVKTAKPMTITEVAMRLAEGSIDESTLDKAIVKKAKAQVIVMGGEGKRLGPSPTSRSDRFARVHYNGVRQ